MPTIRRRRSPRLSKASSSLENENEDNNNKNGAVVVDHPSAVVLVDENETALAVSSDNGSDDDESVDEDQEEEEEEEVAETTYTFQGVEYTTYQDMVNAKRKRNEQVLLDSGLLTYDAATGTTISAAKKKQQLQRGLASNNKRQKKTPTSQQLPKRKSNRLAGIQSDGRHVEEEKGGRFSFAGGGGSSTRASTSSSTTGNHDHTTEQQQQQPEFYRDRINDGSSMSIKQAVEGIGDKWLNENSVAAAERFVSGKLVQSLVVEEDEHDEQDSAKHHQQQVITPSPTQKRKHHREKIQQQLESLRVDDSNCVAKVVPERIYGIAVHPSPNALIVCAGDKVGNVGIWNVDNNHNHNNDKDDASSTSTNDDDDDGVHLFKFHNGAASCLQWTQDGSSLLSASYDGTVRLFDVNTQKFEQVFGTYDNNVSYKRELGYKMDTGYRFWTQYACLDHRNSSGFFLSTSIGTAAHVDLRSKGRVTFYQELSEKKINTLSLHPNGHSLISSGLDCHMRLWDIRMFKNGDIRTSSSSSKPPKQLGCYNGGRSVNSAFFSPSGKYIVSTTMANKLDIFEDFHLKATSATKQTKPTRSIRHDNMTGRWLSTFMAQWHPTLDYFVVGSMRKPRCVEVFDGATASSAGDCTTLQGEALTAVASRCCFHPSTDNLTVVGRNSSGRVTVIR